MPAGPKDWSPRRRKTEEILSLVEDMQRLHPEYRDWVFEWMYPGSFVYHQKRGPVSVFFTPDWNEYGTVDIEVVEWRDGDPTVVDLLGPFGFRMERTAERLFETVKPVLDEHSDELPEPPSMGAVPPDVRLQRPWERTFPLRDALENIFGRAAAPEIHARISRRIGEEPAEQLGEGEKGVAYLLPSGRVLKLTADDGELRAMALLVGKDHPNIVKVHDAFVVRGDGSGTGVVVRDAVDEVLGWSGRHENLVSHLRYSVLRADGMYRRRAALVHPRQALWEAMLFLADEIEREPARKLEAHERALVPGIREAVMGLNELGIFTVDLTPNNIGLTAGGPVLFDLSAASVPEDVVGIV